MVVRVPAIAACALVVIGISSTISMLEPILALYLAGLGVTPAAARPHYGAAAIVTTTMHPIVGRLSDRWGARPTMMLGLLLMSGMIAALGQAWSYVLRWFSSSSPPEPARW
jgi:MFS family permease